MARRLPADDGTVRYAVSGTRGKDLAGAAPRGRGGARRLGARDAETPLIPLDETILIMKTVDTMLALARGDA